MHLLRDSGVKLALITSGDGTFQRRKIDGCELASFFHCILIEGEFGIGKPDERVYLHALDQLAVRPEETWMVGDSLEWDVAAPQRLGITGIWVVWPASKYVMMQGFPRSELPERSDVRPDRIIKRISELVA